MEFPDLNRSPGDEAGLEALLREKTPTLPDDGFSLSVLRALPPPPQPKLARRVIFCLAGAAAGIGFTFWRGILSEWQPALRELSNAFGTVWPSLTDPRVIAALGITALSLLVAYGSELRAKLLN